MTTTIVSASYRTDIPAFYGAWFARRLAAGYALVRNPWSGSTYRVDLDAPGRRRAMSSGPATPPRSCRFWRGWSGRSPSSSPITGYGRRLEPSVPAPGRAVEAAHALAALYGPRCVVWRYDPILSPTQDHVEAAGRLAESLRGATDECVVSFASFYRKTARNLSAAGFAWEDPGPDRRLRSIEALAAAVSPLRLTVCAQPELTAGAAAPARCIDPARLGLGPLPEKGNRPGCACAASRDIGAYDTCPHGCLYCYANASPAAARRRFKAHDPEAGMLG